MFVNKLSLNVVLLLQFVVNHRDKNVNLIVKLLERLHSLVVCMFSEWCTEGEFRKLPLGESNGIFIQYCSGGSWHYLCSGGVGWTPTLATVVCRQLGYSDQGEGIVSYSNLIVAKKTYLQEQK